MTHTSFDAAWPPLGAIAGCDTALIYAGGDTPNPIMTPTRVGAYNQVRFWLPVWVRDNPTQVSAVADATDFVAWLVRNQASAGSSVVLDMESAVDALYVNTFAAALHAAGHRVLVYGDSQALPNPHLDGFFLAQPDGVPHIAAGTVATQYAWMGSYDLSLIGDGVVLWDTKPTPVPVVPPARRNVFTPVAVDGAFGPLTVKALQFVVFDGNVTMVDGLFGPMTKRALQAHLGVAQDGLIGPVTVQALQRRVGALADGSWGQLTTRALQAALNAGTF